MSVRITGFIAMVVAMSLAACAQSATAEPTTEVSAVAVAAPTRDSQSPPLSEDETFFTLDPDLTEARFIIGEILANQPNTVTGVNNLVQGGGVLNVADTLLSKLDEFVIDATGFVTDSTNRNRAINLFILQSSQYPVISFQPTDINGIPAEIVVGEPVTFEIVGQLTIRDVTHEVSFRGEATMVSEDRIEGMASATVLRSDFELSIPSVPRVAGVDEEFVLEIEFVAVAE